MMDDIKEILFWTKQDKAYVNSQRLGQKVQDLYKLKPRHRAVNPTTSCVVIGIW